MVYRLISRDRQPIACVSGQLNAGVGWLLKKNKVAVSGARLDSEGRAVEVAPAKTEEYGKANPPPTSALGPGEYRAKHIIVATGARPRVLPGLEPDGKLIWTYVEAMTPDVTPKSLLVVGSGAIGVEFAFLPRHRRRRDRRRDSAADSCRSRTHEIAALRQQELRETGHQIL